MGPGGTGHVTSTNAAGRKKKTECVEANQWKYRLSLIPVSCRVAQGFDQRQCAQKRLRLASLLYCSNGLHLVCQLATSHLVSLRFRSKLFCLTVSRFRKYNCWCGHLHGGKFPCLSFLFCGLPSFARYLRYFFRLYPYYIQAFFSSCFMTLNATEPPFFTALFASVFEVGNSRPLQSRNSQKYTRPNAQFTTNWPDFSNPSLQFIQMFHDCSTRLDYSSFYRTELGFSCGDWKTKAGVQGVNDKDVQTESSNTNITNQDCCIEIPVIVFHQTEGEVFLISAADPYSEFARGSCFEFLLIIPSLSLPSPLPTSLSPLLVPVFAVILALYLTMNLEDHFSTPRTYPST